MNKMAKTEDIIINFLEDRNWHSISEIKSKILQVDDTLLENDNFIYVVLNNLKDKKGIIEAGGKGTYRIKKHNTKEANNENATTDNTDRKRILKGWKKIYNTSINKYQVSLDMSEEEFRKAKWLHELNKEIEKLIMNYKLDNN